MLATLPKIEKGNREGFIYLPRASYLLIMPLTDLCQRESAPEARCVDSWCELLDRPDSPVLVRSRGNWLGRLAATSISVQMGYMIVLLPDNGCPQGFFTDRKFMRDRLVQVGDVVIW